MLRARGKLGEFVLKLAGNQDNKKALRPKPEGN
jgi:hypothetical protein